MRVAVYDRFWPTGGGGEKFAAGIAAALAGEHHVDLMAHEPVDRSWLGERLALDLSAVGVRLVSDAAGAVSRASGDYDLFVNASYVSGDPNRATRGLYVVHFPGPRPSAPFRARAWLADRGGELLAGRATVTWGEGFYLPEESRLHTLRWTAGDASFRVTVEGGDGGPGGTDGAGGVGGVDGAHGPGGGPGAGGSGGAARIATGPPVTRVPVTVPVVLLLGRFAPAAVGPIEVEAEVDGTTVGKVVVNPPTSRLDRRRSVPLRFTVEVEPGQAAVVWLRCRSWVPADHGIGSDRRRLGIPVVGAHAGGGAASALAGVLPQLVGPGDGLGFLDSYDRLVANSAYTQRWTERMWGRPAGVLHPPVTPFAPGPKEPILLSVGRFFLPGTGHNKKQLEMVRAFRRLVEGGGAKGWTYHLVGGCAPEHRAYLAEIEEEARGLPVVLHPDATGAELADLYARASIFWHAAGLGEDPDAHPDRFEHFGITTVEAMSAGVVPVVIDAAGQAEIVERGRSGMLFSDPEVLVTATRWLIGDEDRRARMATLARQRAATFAWDRFVERTRAEVAALT